MTGLPPLYAIPVFVYRPCGLRTVLLLVSTNSPLGPRRSIAAVGAPPKFSALIGSLIAVTRASCGDAPNA